MEIARLHSAYRRGTCTPRDVAERTLAAIDARGRDGVWISVSDRLVRDAEALDPADRDRLPLWGIPFAVKDNMDVEGWATTAACPSFAYSPQQSAPVVRDLIAAGAILVGETNLDQFATGLNGTRSPYGTPSSAHDSSLISGGSSSGSAVAVAAGLVAFSLATDTAGSGRVPAALNGVVGLKPSVGLVSTRGVVPACRSLDCVSVMANSVADAAIVAQVIAGFDDQDPWSRPLPVPSARVASVSLAGVRLGVPEVVAGWGERGEEDAWSRVRADLVRAGAELVEIDYTPLLEAGRHLYGGAWLAERATAVSVALEEDRDDVDPVVRQILAGAGAMSAAQVWSSMHRVWELRREADDILRSVDALLTPTVTKTYTVEQMRADPVELNAQLGTYTTFTNLLDMCAIAVPAGSTAAHVPFGVTLHGPSGADQELAGLASALADAVDQDSLMEVAVVGAHLEGFGLHHQITDRGGLLSRRTMTAPRYRLYALPGDEPRRPGLVTDLREGARIEVEVYRLPTATVGSFLRGVSAPLAIGTLELDDGTAVHGFVCDPTALEGARDITAYGGWRSYMAAAADDLNRAADAS